MAKTITVSQLIGILPFEKEVKEDLVTRYPDKMSDAEKRTIQRVVWDLYERYFSILLQQNTQEALERVKTKEIELTKDLALQMRVKTEDEIMDWIMQMVDADDMKKARNAMSNNLQ